MSLTGPRRDAKSGQGDSLVIFLHGYGADGNDLIGLADPLRDHLPNTVFVAPDAPEKCINNPFGRQWFPIPHMDGSSEEMARQSHETSVDLLDTFITDTITAEGVTASKTVLVGFSQGTMMALHVGPRRREELAGVVGFSGRLLEPDKLESEAKTKPPILLIHGDQDQVVPPENLPVAADALARAGFEVYTHVSKGMAHGIAQDGLTLALQFILQRLDNS